MRRSRTALVAAVAVAAGCCGAAIAAATLPLSGDGNTINGCYSAKGDLKLLTPSKPTCPKHYTPIHWNVTGPPGTNGTDGTNGISPTVTQLTSGDSHCPAGGAAITDAANTTAYVCSGTPFSGTFTAGDYSISVTSSGITIAGASGQKVTLDSSGIAIEGSPNLDVKANGKMTLESAGAMNLKGDTTIDLNSATTMDLKSLSTTVEGSGLLQLRGALVTLNGGCRPIALVGDAITGSATVPSTPYTAPVTGTILPPGSPTVLGGC